MVITGLIALYIASVIFSYGAMNADWRNFNYDKWGFMRDCEEQHRRDAAICFFFALVPFGNLGAAIIGTRFLAHGWTFRLKK